MNLESCFCFRMYLPCLSLTEKVEQNFQELNVGQDQRNSGYFQHFPVCPIITHWSTLLTIPVAFIFYDLFFLIITINLTLNINIFIDFVFSSRMILKNDFYNKSSVFYHVFGIYRTFIFRCLSLHNTFYLLGCMVNLLVFVCPAPGRIMCSSFLHNPLSALPCLALLVSLKSCRL